MTHTRPQFIIVMPRTSESQTQANAFAVRQHDLKRAAASVASHSGVSRTRIRPRYEAPGHRPITGDGVWSHSPFAGAASPIAGPALHYLPSPSGCGPGAMPNGTIPRAPVIAPLCSGSWRQNHTPTYV